MFQKKHVSRQFVPEQTPPQFARHCFPDSSPSMPGALCFLPACPCEEVKRMKMAWAVGIIFVLFLSFVGSAKGLDTVTSQPSGNAQQAADWKAALEQRSLWPRKVHVLAEYSFDIVLDGAKRGSIKLPKGSLVDIRGVDGENLYVSSGAATGTVPYACTDLLSLIKSPVQKTSPAAAQPVTSDTPERLARPPFKLLPFGDIKPAGWIREQMLRDITSGNVSYLENMRPLGAPIVLSSKRGYGEFEGNFADALIRNAILTGYQPWLDRAKSVADFIVNNQDAHGYIGRKRPSNFQELAENEGELWGQCCFLRAFLAYYEFSKEQKYLDAAIKSVDFMMSLFGSGENRYFIGESSLEGGARAHGLMYVDVLEKLYQLTGNRKYLDFAFRLYEDYSKSENLKNTDHQIPFLLEKNALFLFHAPHVAEHSRVVYWLSTETQNPDFKEAAANSMSKMRASLSPSGGLITDNKILESVGGNRGSADLRYEYCSITEAAISFESAFQKFGNGAMAETAENIVFNAAQAARFSDGKANAYCSKDNQLEAAGSSEGATFRFQYAACHRIACCVYNLNRVMPYYVSHMWLKTADDKSLVAAFYGPSVLNTKINGTDIEIRQQTLYPFENEIELVVNPAREMPLDILLRVPSWSARTDVTAEGAKQSSEEGCIRLTKTWKKGDTVKVVFNPEVEVKTTYNNEHYVKRGALLYALKFEDTKIPTQKWEGTDFANYDVRPVQKEDAGKYSDYKFPASQTSKTASAAFSYTPNQKASPRFPFDTPYGFVRAKFLFEGKEVEESLVPIGSTLLRKTSFEE